jgi:hypothetical protein
MKLLYLTLLALSLHSTTSLSNNKREKFRTTHSLRIVIPEPENIIIALNNRLNVTYDTQEDWSLLKVVIITLAFASGIESYQRYFPSEKSNR